jgi:hypothetical protein
MEDYSLKISPVPSLPKRGIIAIHKELRSLMFNELKEINSRPAPFQFYTADELWANEHTSKQILEYHLNESVDVAGKTFTLELPEIAFVAIKV